MRIPLKIIENIEENVLCKITQNKKLTLVLALKNEAEELAVVIGTNIDEFKGIVT